MTLTQNLEYQQIGRILADNADYLESDKELRDLAIQRAKDILACGSEHGAIKVIGHVVALDRLRLERDLAIAGQSTASIRLSAPANLADVHALLEAMRQPPSATDATLPQVESIQPADAQSGGSGPAQSQ